MRFTTTGLAGLLLSLAGSVASADQSAKGTNVDITDQGTVSATSTFSPSFVPANAVDGTTSTSWFSDGTTTGGDSEVFTWEFNGPGEVDITRIETDPEEFMGGGDFGFSTSQIRFFDEAGNLTFSGPTLNNNAFQVNLTQIFSGTAAHRIELVFTGHQDPICGGFSELRIFADPASLPTPPQDVPPPNDLAAGDRFGGAVAVDGNLYAVGRPGADNGTGDVVIYRIEGGMLVQDAVIDVPGDRVASNFGGALALRGNRLVAAAPGTDAKGGIAALQAAIFERTQQGWTMKSEFSSPSAGDGFGTSVALEGGVVVIGAPEDGEAGQGAGAAHLFRLDEGDNVVQQRKLMPSGASGGENFGQSVATAGGRVAVGAPGSAVGNAVAGAAHLFSNVAANLNNLQNMGVMTGSDPATGDEFGASVALSGSVLVVGAPGEDGDGSNAGAAYRFDPSNFVQRGRVTPAAPQAGAGFGRSVAVARGRFAVGAPGFGNTGAAFAFDEQGSQTSAVTGDADQAGFGSAVAVSADGLAVGAPEAQVSAGAAVIQRDSDLLFRADFE